ncbi:MAG: hypothetical protein K940chlam9_01690 [Chlamydiae bacterium]|nr:hypothetical protein [Chlamydiota bacterium]
MKKPLTILIVMIALSFPPLFATSQNRQDLRCLQLLPELVTPLAVEFALPENFISISPNGKSDPCSWTFWGPRDTLEKFLEDPQSIDHPIIGVQITSNVTQSFLDKQDLSLFSSHKTLNWGDYPVFTAVGEMFGVSAHIAWVGLNCPSDAVLFFNFIYPGDKPTEKELALWNNFLEKTKQLPEQKFYLAMGQDLQPGYTIATCNAA